MRITLLTSVALAALLVAGSASAQRHDGHGNRAPAATGAPTQLVHPGGGRAGRAMHGMAGREMHGRVQHGQSILRGTAPRSTVRFGADRDQHGRDQHGGPAVITPDATGPRNTHGTMQSGGGRGGAHHDWSRYHRTVTASHRYHFGTYRRPRGWVDRRWAVGAFLPSLFWAQQYWINSYYDFGLPPPPPGARWVRYGSDALLIDDYTGEIIQVVYGIFY
jgi:Ni/Co efflux regulator RcnB